MRTIDADELINLIPAPIHTSPDGQDLVLMSDVVEAIKRATTIEPERKTGHWVEVHGYATPGGDPVWACSECGKGQHVYGIEHGTYGKDVSDGQWVTCPNCGTVMEE